MQKKPTQISNENTPFSLTEFLKYTEQRYPLISAHRGGPADGFPENALETFKNTQQINPLLIECDIRISKDSVLVLMHDETINRTSNGKGKVSDYTYKELSDFRLKDNKGKITNFKIPTLEEALNWGRGKVIFTLDVKKDVPYELVIDQIQAAKAEEYCVIITYTARQAHKVYNLANEIYISATIKSQTDLHRVLQGGISKNKLIAFVGVSLPDTPLLDLLHNEGIKTIMGTMGNLDQKARTGGDQVYAVWIDNGIDVLSTDRPLEAHKALTYYAEQRKLPIPRIY